MEVTDEHTFRHFSHQHPLELSVVPSTGNITCNGCNLRILPAKDYYKCKTCSFSLHRVCSNMPRKTRHPALPDRYLTLFASPPSANSNVTCEACRQNISGFYYHAAESGICYHILCSALPLSVTVSSHPHTLKIGFSPPYEFCCDLCGKPSSKGSLYRCRFCEFDTHIACAISNQKATLPDTETNRKVDYGSESNELLQLVVQGSVPRGIQMNDQEVVSNAVAGWDERLQSPRKNRSNISSGGVRPSGLGQQSLDQDPPSTPLNSEDLTIASYQFSDLCFSIDLHNSHAGIGHPYSINKEANSQDTKGFPEVEAKIKYSNMAGPNKTRDDYTKKPVFDPLCRDTDNWFNEAFLAGGVTRNGRKSGQTGEEGLANGYGSRAGIRKQSTESNTRIARYSCWWKLLTWVYHPRSERYCNGSLPRRN